MRQATEIPASRAVLEAFGPVLGLLRHPNVRDRWAEQSACAGMTVGALAAHIGLQATHLATAVAAGGGQGDGDDGEVELVGVVEHYVRAPWRGVDPDAAPNRVVRDRSETLAQAGHESVLDQFESDCAMYVGTLGRAPRRFVLPWTRYAMTFDDFVLTRMLEFVVHVDDLAASIDTEPPSFTPEVFGPVSRLLLNVAERSHGQTALVRALTRAQRAPDTIAVF